MSPERVFLVLASVAINLAAAWQLWRARNETRLAQLRSIGQRANALTAIALFLAFIAPVAGAVLAFERTAAIAVEQRAVALGASISEAMNNAFLGLALALPSLTIALHLMVRARAVQRQSARS